ncbi:MAG TPA: hypothetical protein VIM86_15575 [Thermodesulfobacteriota bacterium]
MLETALAYLGLVALALAAAAAAGLLVLHVTAWVIVRLLGTGDD